MAVVPDLAPPSEEAETPTAAPLGGDLVAGISPRARQSFAAIGGVAQGPELTVSDLAHQVIYSASNGWPTNNRGKRGYSRTAHYFGTGDGLWRA